MSTLRRPPIRHLRYYVIFLFFFASIISYIDRQTLSVNASHIRDEMRLSNSQYGYLVTAFLVAYTIGPTLTGRLMDFVGTRIGMSACMMDGSVRLIASGRTDEQFCPAESPARGDIPQLD